MIEKATLTMSKFLFAKTDKANVAIKLTIMDILGMHYKFQDDLLKISAVINKSKVKQGGMLHQNYQSFRPKQKCQDTLVMGTNCTK